MLNKYIAEISYTRHDGIVDCEEIAEEYLSRKEKCKNVDLQDVIEDYLCYEDYHEVPPADIGEIKRQTLKWIKELEKEGE